MLETLATVFPPGFNFLMNLAAGPSTTAMQPKGNVDFDLLTEKIATVAMGLFGLGTIYFVALIWKNALALAKSGDNPQQMAQAKSGLWANAIGGIIFFGATTVAGLYKYLAQ